jgi:hypothetical protein
MRATLRMVLYLAAFAVGCAFMAYYLQPELLDPALRYHGDHPASTRAIAAGIATIFLLCPLVLLLRWWQLRRRAREISYDIESGRVSVSLQAVEEALTRALENEDCVRRANVHVYEDRVQRQVVIEAVLAFWEVPNVTERNRQCGLILRRRFAELMPEQSAVHVNISVHRITQRREESRRQDTKAPPAPRMPTPAVTRPATNHDPRPVVPSPFAGTPLDESSGSEESHASRRYPTPAQTQPAVVEAQPSEDDLYVGPAYPVEREDDEDGGHSTTDYQGKPVPQRKGKR